MKLFIVLLLYCCSSSVNSYEINLVNFERLVLKFSEQLIPLYSEVNNDLIDILTKYQNRSNSSDYKNAYLFGFYKFPKIVAPLYKYSENDYNASKISLAKLLNVTGKGPVFEINKAEYNQYQNNLNQLTKANQEAIKDLTFQQNVMENVVIKPNISSDGNNLLIHNITKYNDFIKTFTNFNKFNKRIGIELIKMSHFRKTSLVRQKSATASKVLLNFFDFFLSSGCAYINTGRAGQYIAKNLEKQSKLLNKKFNSNVINLPTLYDSMTEAVIQVIENYNIVKSSLENLVKDFWGPYKLKQNTVAIRKVGIVYSKQLPA